MRTTMRIVVGLLVLALGPAAADAGERSPFEGVRWDGDTPRVAVEGTWYELVSLNDLSCADVLAACRALDARRWKKRFNEDLVAALTKAGHPPGPTVALVLRSLEGERAVRTLPAVPMTEAKRLAIWRTESHTPRPRIDRPHSGKVDPRFAFLVKRFHPVDAPALTAKQAAADLDQLEWRIEHAYSYRDLVGLDYRAAFDTVRAGLGTSIPRLDFHIQLRKLVALFGDGHTRVRGVGAALLDGVAPFGLVDTQDGVVAVEPDGTSLGLLRAIDGVPLEQWLHVAGHYTARGSPQFQRRHAVSMLGRINHLRVELGRTPSDEATFTFEVAGKTTQRTQKLADRRVRVGERTLGPMRMLADDIFYLPIRRMNAVESDHHERVLARRAAKARGLILDVRGNGGGGRQHTISMLRALLPADAAPHVANVGCYRVPKGDPRERPRGHLTNRFLRPLSYPDWTDAERDVARRFLATFTPDWTPDPKHFAPWEVMIVSPTPSASWRFEGPVAILIDAGCFSATDIFVGALETLPNVTLLGRATGGGSGRSTEMRLAQSGLRVRVSTMASFRPTGARYDGKGIAPDIEVPRSLDDALGRSDATLDAARAHLRRALGK